LAGSFDRNIIVVGEVDSSLLLGRIVGNTEKFAFDACIGRAWDVFAIAPLSISGSSGRATTSTVAAAAAAAAAVGSTGATGSGSLTWVTVSIWVEWPGFSIWGPAGFTIHGSIAVVGIVVPVTTTGRARSLRSAIVISQSLLGVQRALILPRIYIPRSPASNCGSGRPRRRATGNRASTIHQGGHTTTLAQVWWDVGSAPIRTRVGGMLRLVERQVLNFQAIGHFDRFLRVSR
jgi:hypothetical protein